MKASLTLIFLLISFSFFAQRSTKPWHNHENYKENIIESIKQSPQILYPKQYFDYSRSANNKTDVIKPNRGKNSFDFVNGINIAWVAFGKDIGKDPEYGTEYHPDLNQFGLIMDKVANAGGNVIRWWYHTNGSTNPTYDTNQKVAMNPDFFHEDVTKLLDLASAKGVKLQICLWSFDMLKDQWNVDASANKKILTEDEYFQAYVDNALIPLVNAVGEHPGLYAWEIFNEPEGMTEEFASHWSGFLEKVSMVDVQRFVNRASGAIRRVQPNVKITNGALGFLTNVEDSDKGYQNYYTDSRLEEIGGDSEGYLDFYNIHYYNWAGEEGSPFHNQYDSQKIDKKAVIGEYYPDTTYGVEANDLAITLNNYNWHGSLLWSWTDRSWDTMEPIIINANDYILSVSDFFDSNYSITIAPNPVKDYFTITGYTEQTKICIRDISGKIIFNSIINNNYTDVDMTAFDSGVYYLTLNNKAAKKILKW